MAIFQIIKDVVLNFDRDKKIFLMLINIDNKFCVEANTKKGFIARKFVKNKCQGYEIIQHLEVKLKNYKDMVSACNMIALAFSMETLNETMFLVNILNRKFDFKSLTKLPRIYGCRSFPDNMNLIYVDQTLEYTVQVFFPDQWSYLGVFKASSADSKFIFELNSDFLTIEQFNDYIKKHPFD